MVIQVKIKSHFFLVNYCLIHGGSLLISKYVGTFKIFYFDWFLIYFSYGQRTFSEGSVFWNLLISCPRSGPSWPTSHDVVGTSSGCWHSILCVSVWSGGWRWCWGHRHLTDILPLGASAEREALRSSLLPFLHQSVPPVVKCWWPHLYRSCKYQLVHHSRERKIPINPLLPYFALSLTSLYPLEKFINFLAPSGTQWVLNKSSMDGK